MSKVRFDEIDYWTEVKLDIVKEYARAYSTIVSKQPAIRAHLYIDAFSGAGVHVSRQSGELVPGSPLNGLSIEPKFKEYHFIDLDGNKADLLRQRTGIRSDVAVHAGDCNQILLTDVFTRCRYEEYRRALCLLDPYGLNVSWKVLETAGKMGSIEIFYNFMIMDANRNVLWKNPRMVPEAQKERMDAVWGDPSWQSVVYRKVRGLFEEMDEKVGQPEIAEGFRLHLLQDAGFSFVPTPIPMRNRKGNIIYYLYFASPNATGARIVSQIFDKYRGRGA